MIPIKNCEFCFQSTKFAPLPVTVDYTTHRQVILKVHFCYRCRAEYVYWGDDGQLSGIHLYTTVNNKMYRWSTSTSETTARLWYVEHPGIVGEKPNKGLVLLKRFEEYTPVTPQNIEEKVKFMLPFL